MHLLFDIAFKILFVERPGPDTFACSLDPRQLTLVTPEPPPVGREVQLIGIAVEVAVDPLTVLFVPAEHPIILPPLVPVIKVVA